MKVSIYTVAYNEEFMIPYFINHYRSAFPECKIIIYDNESTDNTVKIAKDKGCEVISFSTNDSMDELEQTRIRNNCWKTSATDWNIVCDIDEFLKIGYINFPENCSIIRTCGYTMHNIQRNFTSFDNIVMGIRETNYDKLVMFNKKYISNINYGVGAHTANPIGDIKYSNNIYKLLHYHFIDLDMVIEKYKSRKNRISENHKKMLLNVHYNKNIDEITEKYYSKQLIKVL